MRGETKVSGKGGECWRRKLEAEAGRLECDDAKPENKLAKSTTEESMKENLGPKGGRFGAGPLKRHLTYDDPPGGNPGMICSEASILQAWWNLSTATGVRWCGLVGVG